jgi:hypothetical protein
MKNKLSILLISLGIFNSCHHDNEKDSSSGSMIKSIDTLTMVKNIVEELDTLCEQDESLEKDGGTTHLIFDFDSICKNCNADDSINLFINEKVRSSVCVNRYASRIILAYDTLLSPSKKSYPYFIRLDSLKFNYLRIDFLKRKIRLVYKLKHYAPFVTFKIDKNNNFKVIYSYCVSEGREG